MNRNSVLRDDGAIRVAEEFQTPHGFYTGKNYGAVLAAAAANVLSVHAADGTTVLPLVQPDVARTLQVKASGAATGVVTIHGKRKGIAVTQALTLNGTTEVHGTHAMDHIDNIVLPSGAYNVSVGFDTKLGLDREPFADDVTAVLIATVDNTVDTITAVTRSDSDPSLNTVSFTTAPDGSKVFRLMYLTFDQSN